MKCVFRNLGGKIFRDLYEEYDTRIGDFLSGFKMKKKISKKKYIYIYIIACTRFYLLVIITSWFLEYIIFSLIAHLNLLSFICDAFYYVLTGSFYTEKREERACERTENEKIVWKVESS